MNASEQALPGVVILGGAHAPLAFARAVARPGLAVWHVTDDNPLVGYSRNISRQLTWAGAEQPGALEQLEAMARTHGLGGYLLLAAGDPEVKLIAQNYERLSGQFRLATLPWEQLVVACDKSQAYRRAGELGIGFPKVHDLASLEEARAANIQFPAVMKPRMRLGDDPFTAAKAWRVDTHEEFLAAYEKAAGFVGPGNIVVQELIPGDGATQFSYTAVWNKGAPVAEFVALRRRQYPVEFGAGTFVEVVENDDVVDVGRRFLSSIAHHGPVEIEFKRDPRDGRLKLIDVNPRLWTWFGLAKAAGLDYGALVLDIAAGVPRNVSAAPVVGTAWMYLPRDFLAAAQMMFSRPRAIGLGEYLSSFAKVRSWGVFDPGDLVPALADIPLGFSRMMAARRKLRKS